MDKKLYAAIEFLLEEHLRATDTPTGVKIKSHLRALRNGRTIPALVSIAPDFASAHYPPEPEPMLDTDQFYPPFMDAVIEPEFVVPLPPEFVNNVDDATFKNVPASEPTK